MQTTTTSLLRAIHRRPHATFPSTLHTRFSSTQPRIAILPGSARDHANNPGIQHWVAEAVRRQLSVAKNLNHKPVDVILADIRKPPMGLGPLTDTALPAAVRDPSKYGKEATRAWSEFVTSCDAFVVVSPEYNGSYPGELKNALDHLYWEWQGKNVVIVTYGGGGGGRVAAQLKTLLGIAMKMKIVGEVGVKLPVAYVEGDERVPTDTTPEFLVEKQAQLDSAIEALVSVVNKQTSKA
ncbi:flavo protein [Dentipellis sp. KUC8613]|nr:flavo protein [Dentipellis sp. KUC8613]